MKNYYNDKYYSHQKYNYHKENKISKQYKEINIGNPVVNVHLDECKKDKKKQYKKCCECSGIVNNILSPTTRLIINICPNCENKTSSILDQIGTTSIFSSTYISPPHCFTTRLGTVLTTGGSAIFLRNGVLFEGVFNIFLIEEPGATDRVIRSFLGTSATGVTMGSLSTIIVPDANLSIRQCNSYDCSCTSPNTSSIPLINTIDFEKKIVNKTFIINPNGEIEEFEK
ncbi:hypothetical protein MHB59_28575 [Bacillus sp. FSL L8-0642]|uniref:hypothetical protein n=1 Tax=Bacillus sp. FSL L8-0642 TaxID=2921525 RepID=UPI0030FAB647